MDGYAAQSELSPSRRDGRVRFSLAGPTDHPEIRRLLRENPMPGRVSISLEREPEARVAAAIEGDVHHTIIARDEVGGWIVAMGSVSVRERYVNGEATRVGYLGQLRVDQRRRSRMAIIRGGYAMLRELHPSLGVRLYLTSIASDNAAARRLLERGLPGMPTYRPLAEFVTLVFRRRRNGEFHKVTANVRCQLRRAQLEIRHGVPELLPDVEDLLNGAGARQQFAPAWPRDSLLSLAGRGLRPSHVRLIRERGRPIACGGVWDQRAIKQSVVRGYPLALWWGRLPLNLLAPLTRLPRLPPIGQPVNSAFVSHLVTPANRPDLIEPLIRSLHGSAASLGVDCLVAGFDARDPRLGVVRRAFGGMEYRTQLYVVHWPEDAPAAESVDRKLLLAPEVALL